MIKVYIDTRTKASLQGSGDLKSRVRDPHGISNVRLPVAKLEQLDDFFKARNEIVHDLDYENPSAPAELATAGKWKPSVATATRCSPSSPW